MSLYVLSNRWGSAFSDSRSDAEGSSAVSRGWEGEVNVAGVDPADLSLEYRDRKIVLKKKDEPVYYFAVPRGVDPETIRAEYKFGMLKVTADPKQSELPRQIAIAALPLAD